MDDFYRNFRLLRDCEVLDRRPGVLYLAYGSNLSIERMKERCPDAEVAGKTALHGYRLLFKESKTGFYATIEQDANCMVPAVVYRISEYDEARLDRFEGFPKHYYKRRFLISLYTLEGKWLRGQRKCMAYVLHENRLLGKPGMEYFNLLDEGYRAWNFDTEFLDLALYDSIGKKASRKYLKEYEEQLHKTSKQKGV